MSEVWGLELRLTGPRDDGVGPYIQVEKDGCDSTKQVLLETGDVRHYAVFTLTPQEARDMAAQLIEFADKSDRTRRKPRYRIERSITNDYVVVQDSPDVVNIIASYTSREQAREHLERLRAGEEDW